MRDPNSKFEERNVLEEWYVFQDREGNDCYLKYDYYIKYVNGKPIEIPRLTVIDSDMMLIDTDLNRYSLK